MEHGACGQQVMGEILHTPLLRHIAGGKVGVQQATHILPPIIGAGADQLGDEGCMQARRHGGIAQFGLAGQQEVAERCRQRHDQRGGRGDPGNDRGEA
jgi:hypothetical protein